jgi:CRISPR-associated protein Csb2
VRVQSEPFHARGARAEAFAPDRFPPRRLQHVEIDFAEPVTGPLVIGDGRWLGLGVMCPARVERRRILTFAVQGGDRPAAALGLPVARALRRAVMARVQAVAGERLRSGEQLPPFFTGHEPAGAPARSGDHRHLFFLADDNDGDGRIDRLAIISPDLVDRSSGARKSELAGWWAWLEEACAGFSELRAGKAGKLILTPADAVEDDRLFGTARDWRTRTPYSPTRHPRRAEGRDAAIAADLVAECVRRGLPRPEVRSIAVKVGPRGGLAAEAELRFRVTVRGPVLIGRDSHFGSGVFAAAGQ